VERKLAAIFATDIAGYSRLMERDEAGRNSVHWRSRGPTPAPAPGD
jgi:hypothetical protein